MNTVGNFYKKHYKLNKPQLDLRAQELINAAERLESWTQRKISTQIYLSISLERMDSLVTSYFYDIIRYKSFHGMLDEEKESRINLQKIYSFTTKWIIREKPLYMQCGDIDVFTEEEKNKYIYICNIINELWAVQWIESSYQMHTDTKLGLTVKESKNNYDFFYLMKYRDFSSAMFEELLDTKVNHEILQQL